jgi:KDO2-lipid IV(A) lauroyltransferase
LLAAAAVRFLVGVLRRVPPPLVPPLSEAAGTAAWLLSARARDAVRANQLVIVPGRRPRVRRTFVNQVRNYLDTFRLLGVSAETVRDRVDVDGWDRFLSAHARGRGVVIASAHFGPVNVCGQILISRGYPTTMPVEDETGELARIINRARAALGGTFVATSSARGVYRVLRQGGVLGVIADRAVTGVGERVEFFGREALLPSAHISLALRAGAPVLPAFAYRTGQRFCLRFEEPLELARSGDHDADVRNGMREFVRVMERHLGRRPEEWTVFERIWG